MEGETVEHVTLTSSKITGDGDRDRLETALSGVEGVRSVDVDTAAHTVDVEFDPRVVSETRVRTLAEQAGYASDAESLGSPLDKAGESQPA